MMAELSGASPVWLHVTGAMMVGGRLIHAAHLALYPTTYNLRPPAVVLTLTGLLLGAALALVG